MKTFFVSADSTVFLVSTVGVRLFIHGIEQYEQKLAEIEPK